VMYSYNRSQQDALFLNFIFDIKLYMFRTDLLSIIRSLDTVFTATGICYTSYVDCLQTRSGNPTSPADSQQHTFMSIHKPFSFLFFQRRLTSNRLINFSTLLQLIVLIRALRFS